MQKNVGQKRNNIIVLLPILFAIFLVTKAADPSKDPRIISENDDDPALLDQEFEAIDQMAANEPTTMPADELRELKRCKSDLAKELLNVRKKAKKDDSGRSQQALGRIVNSMYQIWSKYALRMGITSVRPRSGDQCKKELKSMIKPLGVFKNINWKRVLSFGLLGKNEKPKQVSPEKMAETKSNFIVLGECIQGTQNEINGRDEVQMVMINGGNGRQLPSPPQSPSSGGSGKSWSMFPSKSDAMYPERFVDGRSSGSSSGGSFRSTGSSGGRLSPPLAQSPPSSFRKPPPLPSSPPQKPQSTPASGWRSWLKPSNWFGRGGDKNGEQKRVKRSNSPPPMSPRGNYRTTKTTTQSSHEIVEEKTVEEEIHRRRFYPNPKDSNQFLDPHDYRGRNADPHVQRGYHSAPHDDRVRAGPYDPRGRDPYYYSDNNYKNYPPRNYNPNKDPRYNHNFNDVHRGAGDSGRGDSTRTDKGFDSKGYYHDGTGNNHGEHSPQVRGEYRDVPRRKNYPPQNYRPEEYRNPDYRRGGEWVQKGPYGYRDNHGKGHYDDYRDYGRGPYYDDRHPENYPYNGGNGEKYYYGDKGKPWVKQGREDHRAPSDYYNKYRDHDGYHSPIDYNHRYYDDRPYYGNDRYRPFPDEYQRNRQWDRERPWVRNHGSPYDGYNNPMGHEDSKKSNKKWDALRILGLVTLILLVVFFVIPLMLSIFGALLFG